MKYLTRGNFGIVLGIGAGVVITNLFNGSVMAAVVTGVLTVIAALAVFLLSDRKRV